MKNIAAVAILLPSVLVTACSFQSKTDVLLPTAPSNPTSTIGGGTSTSALGASSSAATSSSATSAFAGAWASSPINGLPNVKSCSSLQWQISNLSPTEIAGSISAVCAGSVAITATISGKLNGADVVDLTANGQAVA